MKVTLKHFAIFACLLSLFSCMQTKTSNSSELARVAETPSNSFIIQRGVNISHFLSQTDRNDDERKMFFNEKDIALISNIGYDHIRLPIDEKNMWDEEGIKIDLAFDALHNILSLAQEHELKVIVDLHIVRSHYFNDSYNPLWDEVEEQEKFVSLWLQLSNELKKYPNDMVAYEILNEPVANDPRDWNNLIAATLQTIRKEEPNRTVVIGSNKWNSVNTFGDLEIPENDKNLILSFHFYSPHVFTHYKAPWSKKVGFYTGPVQYPGKPLKESDLKGYEDSQVKSLLEDNAEYSKEFMESKMKNAIAVAKKMGLPLHCGEFGSYPSTSEEDRLAWYGDMVSIFQENNIAWSNWDYKGGFGIVNSTGDPKQELIKVLLKADSQNSKEKKRDSE